MYTRFFAKCCIALATALFFTSCGDDPSQSQLIIQIEVLAYNESSNDFELTPPRSLLRWKSQDVHDERT
jgi:hypothetical protein